MKIIIIGAGIASLYSCKYLGRIYDVTIFEEKTYEKLAYDWQDDVENKVFSELGVKLYEEEYFRTIRLCFGIPFSQKLIHVNVNEDTLDYTIERRPFAQHLADDAIEAGAKINFDSKVQKLIIEDGKVCGVIVDRVEYRADLVIDNSGALSKFRESLPKEFKIDKQPKKWETFKAYRAFYNQNEGIDVPPLERKKIYLKHIGEDGISWCVLKPNGVVDVLIGRIGEMSTETLHHALAELKKDNPIIGDNVVRGGQVCTIPVRYILPRMCANGYLAIGDAAFMTIPMIGSGIANSLRAGRILAEVLSTRKSLDINTLWEFEYLYVTKIGAGEVMVDNIKRMLLGAPGEDIKFLFESGIIGENELSAIAAGAKIELGPSDIIEKIKAGYKKIPLLLKLVGAITKGQKAEKLAYKIPKEYNEKAIDKWQKKLDKIYNK